MYNKIFAYAKRVGNKEIGYFTNFDLLAESQEYVLNYS